MKKEKKKEMVFKFAKRLFNFLIRNGILGNLVNKKSTKSKQLLVSNTFQNHITKYYTDKTSISKSYSLFT